jgi:hypothetical protein
MRVLHDFQKSDWDDAVVWLQKSERAAVFIWGGFKYELQHGLTRRETPRGVS